MAAAVISFGGSYALGLRDFNLILPIGLVLFLPAMVLTGYILGCFVPPTPRPYYDQKIYRKNSRYRSGHSKEINRTFFRLRLIVLIALASGMRMAEIFGLQWSDIFYSENVMAVRAKLKRGKTRYVPLSPELAQEFRCYPAILGEERIFPPKLGAKGERQRVERSFGTILRMAGVENFRFHDLRHTFASWYMMNGGDLYELAKILGHSNIRMTERYAKLARSHIARTGNTAREIWKMMAGKTRDNVRGTAGMFP